VIGFRLSQDRARRALHASLFLAAAAILSGCGATLSRAPLLGEPEDAPRAPAEPVEFPNVGVSGAKASKPMSPEERAKLQQELLIARDRSAAERRQRIEDASRR
jgi:hypothetical protein